MRAANDDLIVVCAGKQLASDRKGQGQGRGICSLWAAENSRPSAAGEFARFASRRIAAKGRGGSKSPSFPDAA